MSASSVSFLQTVWRASELSAAVGPTVGSGHALLDAALPGAGWPCGSLTELLQAQAGVHEWRLLLPALRAVVGTVVLVGCPHLPNAPALASQGLPVRALLRVQVERPADVLWAAEQALRCREVGAVLVWLTHVRSDQLRRLQMAAQSANQLQAPLVFAFRPLTAQYESSPAPLRIRLQGAPDYRLALDIIKRRGSTLDRPLLLLPELPPALRKRSGYLPVPAPVLASTDFSSPVPASSLHAVDRPRTLSAV